MPAAGLLRKALALTVAYAIVLGGVTGGYALASGNIQPLCATGTDTADGGTGSAPLPAHAAPDCCPGLCNGQAAVPSPMPVLIRTVSFSPVEWRLVASRTAAEGLATAKLARAPPRD